MNHPPIVFRSVTKRYLAPNGEIVTVLDGVTFEVREDEVVGLVGPSGCGKSTTLKLVSGLTFADSGSVLVDGKAVDRPRQSIGFMLQKDLLLPWKTVAQNAELGLSIRGVPRAERRERATSVLVKYGLGDFLDYHPHQLSGGMRQRVALARTMVLDPKILLLDEPFAAVDFQTKLVLQDDLSKVLRESRMTGVYITHDLGEAITLCDRVLVMSRRPARVKAEYSVEMPPALSVMEKRQHPRFNVLFQEIWSQLDIDARMPGSVAT